MTDRVRIIKHETIRSVDRLRSATRMIGPACISTGMISRVVGSTRDAGSCRPH